MSTPELAPSPQFQKEETFREDRVHTLGGSDAGSLYGLEPYGCQRRLFNQKTGVTPDFIFMGSNATRRGQMLEDFAAQLYMEKTGRSVRRVAPKHDEIVSCLRPQPDREIVNDAWGDGKRGILSIKVPGREAYFKIKTAVTALLGPEPKTEWEKAQVTRGKQTLHPYILQLQAEMAAQKVHHGSFVFFNADLWELVYVDIDRDEEVIADIRARALKFWEDKEAGIAPPKLDPKARQCKSCEFRVSCQQDSLLKLLEKEGDDTDVAVLPILDQKVALLREREELLDEAQALVDETKDELRAIMEESKADVGQSDLFRVYFRLQAGRKSFQAAEFARAYPDLKQQMEKFWKTGSPFRVLKTYDLVRKAE